MLGYIVDTLGNNGFFKKETSEGNIGERFEDCDILMSVFPFIIFV